MERNHFSLWQKYVHITCSSTLSGPNLAFRGRKLFVPPQVSVERQKDLDDGLVTMIVTDNLPLTILSRMGFREFVKVHSAKNIEIVKSSTV